MVARLRLGGLCLRRVEQARVDQGLVSPAGRANEDGCDVIDCASYDDE